MTMQQPNEYQPPPPGYWGTYLNYLDVSRGERVTRRGLEKWVKSWIRKAELALKASAPRPAPPKERYARYLLKPETIQDAVEQLVATYGEQVEIDPMTGQAIPAWQLHIMEVVSWEEYAAKWPARHDAARADFEALKVRAANGDFD